MVELRLTDEEMAFLRFTSSVFFTPESPLYYVEQQNLIPASFKTVVHSLSNKGVVNAADWQVDGNSVARISTVSECDGRVLVISKSPRGLKRRNFYVRDGMAVEYQRVKQQHLFGRMRPETSLVAELALGLKTSNGYGGPACFRFSASEFLTFSILARDCRLQQRSQEERLSVEEIKRRLAEIDDMPDGSLNEFNRRWAKQIKAMVQRGYLDIAEGQPILCPALQQIAAHLSTRRQKSFVRYDFIDEEWLLRQLVLYPQKEATIQLGTLPDGAIQLALMTPERLADAIAEVVGSLPDLDTLDLANRSVTDLLLGR